MRLKFAPSVSQEMREYLRQSLKEYEDKTPMSDEERHELYAWVSEGNSVYSNPSNSAFESGWEMDFISGIRFDQERFEMLSDMSPENYAGPLECDIPDSVDNSLLD